VNVSSVEDTLQDIQARLKQAASISAQVLNNVEVWNLLQKGIASSGLPRWFWKQIETQVRATSLERVLLFRHTVDIRSDIDFPAALQGKNPELKLGSFTADIIVQDEIAELVVKGTANIWNRDAGIKAIIYYTPESNLGEWNSIPSSFVISPSNCPSSDITYSCFPPIQLCHHLYPLDLRSCTCQVVVRRSEHHR
jgi:hypothetical protein